jgi:SAM-dependent methyltransferase
VNEAIPPAAIRGAEAYEDLHVAALFAEWAPRMLDALRVAAGDDVLDVACGTGVLAREAAGRVGDRGSVTGLDLDPAMLAVAARITPEVTWRSGDAGSLPFDEGRFDVVANQFGLMFVVDRRAAVREMLRVARPGGRVGAAVWDALEASPAYPIEVELLDRLAGSAAADALRAPFVLGSTTEVVQLFESAGADAVEAITINGEARFPSVRSMVEADLRGWLPVMDVHLEEDTIERILAEAEKALARFVTDDGEVVFDSPAHIVKGVSR